MTELVLILVGKESGGGRKRRSLRRVMWYLGGSWVVCRGRGQLLPDISLEGIEIKGRGEEVCELRGVLGCLGLLYTIQM